MRKVLGEELRDYRPTSGHLIVLLLVEGRVKLKEVDGLPLHRRRRRGNSWRRLLDRGRLAGDGDGGGVGGR